MSSLGLSLGLSLRGTPSFGLAPSLVSTVGGTTIIVTGPALTDATIEVDGAPVVVTPISGTSVSFPAPAHAAGPVSVVVTTADLLTHTLPLTYQAPVVLTSLAPNPVSPVGGTVVTVTGTGMANATAVTVGGTSCAVTPINATSFSFVMPAKDADTYDVIAQSALGNSNTITIEAAVAPNVIYSTNLLAWCGPTTTAGPYTWVNEAGTGNLVDIVGTAVDATTPSGYRAVEVSGAETVYVLGSITSRPAGPCSTIHLFADLYVPALVTDGVIGCSLSVGDLATHLVAMYAGCFTGAQLIFVDVTDGVNRWLLIAPVTTGWRRCVVTIGGATAALFIDGVDTGVAPSVIGGAYFAPDLTNATDWSTLYVSATEDASHLPSRIASAGIAYGAALTTAQRDATDAFLASKLVAP